MLSDARVYATICFLARLHLATYYIIHDLGLRIRRTGTSFIHLRLPNNSRIYTKLTSHSFCNPILKTSSSSCRLFCSGGSTFRLPVLFRCHRNILWHGIKWKWGGSRVLIQFPGIWEDGENWVPLFGRTLSREYVISQHRDDALFGRSSIDLASLHPL